MLLLLLVLLLFSIVQGADWHFGARDFGEQPAYVKKAALATMIICFICFVAYLIFLVSHFSILIFRQVFVVQGITAVTS